MDRSTKIEEKRLMRSLHRFFFSAIISPHFLGEAEHDKVIMQSFNDGQNILRGIILKKEEDKKHEIGS